MHCGVGRCNHHMLSPGWFFPVTCVRVKHVHTWKVPQQLSIGLLLALRSCDGSLCSRGVAWTASIREDEAIVFARS